MDAKFWRERWETNNIAFHLNVPNPALVAHFPKLGLVAGSRVFVPLCGKSLDMPWLLGQGYRVAGCELSELAVTQFFTEMKLKPEVRNFGAVKHFYVPGLDIYAGDIFDLKREVLGTVDSVYDRAALVALPEDMRRRYTDQIFKLTAAAPQLLVTFEYDQSLMDGPPFSVREEFLKSTYGGSYTITPVARGPLAGGLKNGQIPAEECVWILNFSH